MTSIPGWIDLLDAALTVIAEAERLAGQPIEWTLGGGTAIMVAHAHRLSRDVDLFLHEAQMLPMLSPRLNDGAAALTEVYGESASAVRLELGPGEIDFILAPDLTGLPAPPRLVHGRRVPLQHPIEIVAKKGFYRTAGFTFRDAFDMAVVLDRHPAEHPALARVLTSKADVLARRLAAIAERRDEMPGAVTPLPGFEDYLTTAPDICRRFVAKLR